MLLLQDFRDMSGLAGGVSKLAMTLTSTGMSMLTSFYFSDWGRDKKGSYTHFHAQRLLYSLAAITVALPIWFWFVYVPVDHCARRAARRAPDGNDGIIDASTDASSEASITSVNITPRASAVAHPSQTVTDSHI